MAVTGHDYCTLVCLIGGQRLRYFDVDRNQRFIDASFQSSRNSGARSKPGGPACRFLARDGEDSARLHPDDSGETIMLPQEAAEWTDAIEQAKEQIKAWEGVKTEAENIKAARR